MQKPIFMLAAAVLIAAALARPGWASVASFELERRVWYASEIVLVEQQGDEVTVLETWRGTLTKGTVISRLDLPKMPLAVSKRWNRDEDPPVASVTGRRVVLFLKRPPERAGLKPPRDWVGADHWWAPAEASAVWLEEGQAYAMQHTWSDEPLKMSALIVDQNKPTSEDDFKRQMQELLSGKDALGDALQVADPATRVEMLDPMTQSRSQLQRHEAIVGLGQCGRAAVLVLEKLMRKYGISTGSLAYALVQAYGDEAPARMTALLKEEMAFWREEASQRAGGPQGRLELPDQMRQTISWTALGTIERSHYTAAREVVLELRDFWVAWPRLDAAFGTSTPLSKRCDEVLKSLDRK